ncbi:MAG: PCMD domain-containing protein [Bacteroidales bacterium]|nr:PCMD domain-containing protein [Bacteroidales bacterium]
MKRHIIDILAASLALLSVASCNEKSIDSEGTGCLAVGMLQDDKVILKSVEAPSDDMTFAISVYRGDELVASRDDHRTLTSDDPIEIAAGAYRVVAVSGDEGTEAAFDAPFYSGETDVNILPQRLNYADIVATLSNVMVTVSFDSSITDEFTGYSVLVSNSSDNGLNFSKEDGTLDKTGYLRADGTLKWTLTLVNSDGEEFVMKDTYTDVKAQQHYALKFAVGEKTDDTGYGAFKLIVDDSMTEKEYDLVLDFDNSSLPQITTNEGFELVAQNYITVGNNDSRIFNFEASKGIRSLVITGDDAVMSKVAAWNELVDADDSMISALAAKGIKASSVAYGSLSASVDVTDFIASLGLGEYSMSFLLYDIKGHLAKVDFNFTVISDVDADIVSAAPWAKFVVVEGKWFAQDAPAGLTFSYRKASDADWTSIPETNVEMNVASRTYSAVISSLDAETTYQVRAISAKDTETRYIEFTTEPAQVLYNMGFDDWWQDSGAWYPYLQDAQNPTWDTANGGTKMLSLYPTTPESEHLAVAGEGKRAARLESAYKMKFAAGNIYTGKFGKVILSPMGASLDWGVEFSSRPVALKGYYDYSPAAVNYTNSPYDYMKGQDDIAQIQVILTDWDAPFNVDTGNKRFVDVQNDPAIIAYGTMDCNRTDGYVEFTIPIVYRDVTRTPKYIVVVGAASKYGDYFTGGVGSLLYLDEFSFEYDLASLTPEQANQVNYK